MTTLVTCIGRLLFEKETFFTYFSRFKKVSELLV